MQGFLLSAQFFREELTIAYLSLLAMKYFPVILVLVSVLYCNARQSSGV
jgi:hypothetical protein